MILRKHGTWAPLCETRGCPVWHIWSCKDRINSQEAWGMLITNLTAYVHILFVLASQSIKSDWTAIWPEVLVCIILFPSRLDFCHRWHHTDPPTVLSLQLPSYSAQGEVCFTQEPGRYFKAWGSWLANKGSVTHFVLKNHHQSINQQIIHLTL